MLVQTCCQSLCRSVCLSVGLLVGPLSGGCTVAKQLIGSVCRLGGEWGRSRDGCIKWGGDCRRGSGSFGVNVGHPIVINGNHVT